MQQQLKKLAAKSRPLRNKGDFAAITIMKSDKFGKKVATNERLSRQNRSFGDADENPTQIREIWRSACTRGKTSLRQSSSS